MRSKYAKRTDANQPAIVDELRRRGLQVELLSHAGNDVPDLLVGFGGGWYLFELKTAGGDLSRGQMEWIARARGGVGVVTSADEVVSALRETGLIGQAGKERIAKWLLRNPTQGSLSLRRFREVVSPQKTEKS